MSVKKNVATTGAIAVLLASGMLITAPVAAADSGCLKGQKATSVQASIHNPETGKDEVGTVIECVTELEGANSIISGVTPAVGVDFRDDSGTRTASGLGQRDRFLFLGQKKQGRNGDGTLIKVRQITKGQGGWGDRYEGWIPVKYTEVPSLFS